MNFLEFFKNIFSTNQNKSGKTLDGQEVINKLGVLEYDPNLVGELQDDHQYLLDAWGQIGEAAEERDTETVTELLRLVPLVLTEHCEKEERKVYNFVRLRFVKAMAGKDERTTSYFFRMSQKILLVRRQMVDIKRSLEDFCRKWSKPNALYNDVAWSTFMKEFQAFTAALGKRIAMEEERLYKMYTNRPPTVPNWAEYDRREALKKLKLAKMRERRLA